MNTLEDWKEITKGLYRYVIAANICYEIHLVHWYHHDDILKASASLYIVGDWVDDKNVFFERELLYEGTVEECLDKAVMDDKENNEYD